jgi:UDP-glucuronate decarboxylase
MNYFKNKRILITGSSGLVGYNLISFLQKLDFNFYCLCLINRNPQDYFLDQIKNDYRFEYKQFDLINNSTKLENFDIIFHLATYGQPLKFMENELDTIKLNTQVTIELLNKLNNNGKILFLSTSEIYSGLEGIHSEEEIGTTDPTHPRACYIESKRCGEAICNIAYRNNIDVKIIRLCLAYGQGVRFDDQRALNNFIIKALTQNKIKLLDNGMAKRSYIYIDDVINMIIKIILNGKSLIYNIGGKEEIRIIELASKIANKINVPLEIPDNSDILFSPKCVKLNIDKYEKEFGDVQLININQGINNVINWYKNIKE